MINRNRRVNTWGALIGATLLSSAVSVPAFAEDDAMLEEVVVTGSRIKRDAGSYTGPMTTLLGETVTQSPNFSLNDALLEMPAIGSQGLSRNNANGGRGSNYSGIHQLNPERTLTLFNGKRTVSNIQSSLSMGVDLQSFPVNMIDRVEVLADGASSIYGSDAVAGVINLIPKTNFEGFEVSIGAGSPSEDGGDHVDAGLLFGITGDRGFFTAAISYVDDGDVDYQDRDFSQIPILGQLDVGGGQILTLMGSGIPPEGRILETGAGVIFKPDASTGLSYQPYDTFCLSNTNGADASGSLGCILNQGHRFNYNDIPTGVSLVNENQAVNFSGIGEYTFDNGMVGYISTILAHREGRLNFTPLPIQGAAGRFTDLIQVPFDHPLLPSDARSLVQGARAANCAALGDPAAEAACLANPNFQMSWRGLDAGPRTFDYDSDTIAATIGLRGSFDNNWEWDVWATVGRSELFEVTKGQVNVGNLQIAVNPDACALVSSCPKDANGDPTLNIFGRSAKTQEEINFITFDDIENTEFDMVHFAAAISGEVGDLGAGPIGLAFGAEYRDESGGVQPSGIVQLGDSGGNFNGPTDGSYDVTEIYGEVSIPLLQDSPGAEELNLDLAVRWSDYSTFGDEATYKAAVSWAPIETLRFRGTYATGYRAPNILELFGGIADTFQSVVDPCTAPIGNVNVQANCTAAGVPVGFVQPAAQLKISAGGNEELDAETSDSFSVGAVWEPDFAQLRVSLDWYDAEIDDAIGTPDPVNVITACYNSPGGSLSAPECDRLGRGPAGDIVRFDLLNENVAKIETSGIDLDVAYSMNVGFGDLEVNWMVNYLDEWKQTLVSGFEEDRTGQVAGAVSSWAAYPELRSTVNARLTRDNWFAGLTYRYIDEMEAVDVIGFGTLEPDADAVHYVDLDFGYEVGQWNFFAGVQNVTDEEPPYVTDVSVNTSTVYDFLGRFYFARATYTIQ
jgi:iron complex outermembrane receptor protein